jgi:hypothetical protein
MNLTGTKSGDTWSASGTDGTSIVSIEQTLSSDDNSSGTIRFRVQLLLVQYWYLITI